jgi:hypothetical protein
MTKWEKMYQEHPIHATFRNVLEQVKALEISGDAVTESVLNEYTRMSFVLEQMKSLLETTTGDAFVWGELQYNQGTLHTLDSHFKNYVLPGLTNQNTIPAKLQNINQILDQHIIPYFKQLPKQPLVASEPYISHAQGIVAKTQEIILQLQADKIELESKLKILTEKSDEVHTTIEEQKTLLAVEITKANNIFLENEKTRAADYVGHAERQFREHQTLFESILKGLDEEKKKAEKIIGVLGTQSLTYGYQQKANDEKEFYERWRGIAFTFMGISATCGVIVLAKLLDASNKLDLEQSILRFLSVSVTLIPAFYAAREAEKHRKNVAQFRKMELELATMDPFLNDLTEDNRVKMKEKLALQYFSGLQNMQADVQPVKEGTEVLGKLVSLFKEIKELLGKIAK